MSVEEVSQVRNKLFCVLLAFWDPRNPEDARKVRWEHGVVVATDEESALMTAVETSANAHRGEVLFSSDAMELVEADLERLIEHVKGEPRTVDVCIVSSYRVRAR